MPHLVSSSLFTHSVRQSVTGLKNILANRPFVGAILFVLLLFSLEEFLFGFPQAKFYQFVVTFLQGDEIWIAFLSVAASFLFSIFFIWVALRSSRSLQILYTFLIALSSLIQYGYWKAVDRFLITADLKIAIATPINTWKGASLLFFDWRFVLPVAGFICFLFLCSKQEAWKPSFLKFGTVLVFTLLLGVFHTFTNQPVDLGLSFSSFYQTIARYVIEDIFPSRREILNYQHPESPENNIVLVIDESIRGDHLSVNGYERKTTPFLDELASTEEGFHTFGLAVAGATCSYSSNALILTGVRPGQDEFAMTASYPTVFQYAKAMGYKTYYMDAQSNSFWNGLTGSDISFIDTWLKAQDFGNDLESDFRAADRIAEIVASGPGNFIVLNKRGVHFLYESSYPPESIIWFPIPADYTKEPHLVSNPYDNGIFYNLNTFFKRLLIYPEILENTTILYTSDHGQTLFENNASWLHCNYTSQEATVPLILLGRNLPPLPDRSRASHGRILPTLLDLMVVPSNQRLHPYSPSLFDSSTSATTDQFFFDGSLRLIQFPD
jgi:glucan phosphoethanolaminetransferase (alkaline phosphatase superfamily)